MKANWQTKKLGEICEILIGGTPSRGVPEYWRNGTLPWVSISDMSREGDLITNTYEKITEKGAKESNVKLIPKDSLLFSFKLSIGKLALAGSDLYTNEAIAALVVKDQSQLDKKFLRYYISQMVFDNVTTAVKGSTLNKEKIKNLEITLPPLKTQNEIVARLDKKFAKLRKAKRLREESLVDTEKILSQTLREIFEEGKEKGWEEKTLEEVAPVKRETNKKLLPYVGMEDVESATGKFLGNLEPRKVQSNTFYFDNTCVLYGRLRPYLNKVLIPDFVGHCSTEMFPLVPKKDVLLKWYLFYWITQNSFVNDATRTAGGARMPRANMKEVMRFKILIPSLPEQHQIVTRLDTLTTKLHELRQLQTEQLKNLKKLEKTYLREAFNGELV